MRFCTGTYARYYGGSSHLSRSGQDLDPSTRLCKAAGQFAGLGAGECL